MLKAHTRILGVGSPFGDDRVGWIVVDLIRNSPWYRSRAAGSLSAQAFDRPGPALLAAMDGAAHAVLIDAMQSGAVPGTVRKIELGRLAMSGDSFASSHCLGLADTLMLGKALDLLAPRITLVTVERGCVQCQDGLTAAVQAALPLLLHCVRACVSDGESVIDRRLCEAKPDGAQAPA
jgi:hydrogenase maturation protease